MSPNETLFLESTSKIVRDDVSNSSFVQFEIWDFPGQIDPFDPTFDSEVIFGGCGALIFVIDSQVPSAFVMILNNSYTLIVQSAPDPITTIKYISPPNLLLITTRSSPI